MWHWRDILPLTMRERGSIAIACSGGRESEAVRELLRSTVCSSHIQKQAPVLLCGIASNQHYPNMAPEIQPPDS